MFTYNALKSKTNNEGFCWQSFSASVKTHFEALNEDKHALCPESLSVKTAKLETAAICVIHDSWYSRRLLSSLLNAHAPKVKWPPLVDEGL